MRDYSVSVTLMFREFPPLERFAKAREAGFDRVEIQALEAAPDEVTDAAAAAGTRIHLLNVGMGDFLQGGAGLIGMPGQESNFKQQFDMALALARQADIPLLHLGAGRVPETERRENCLKSLVTNARYAIERAAGSDVTLVIEPLNCRDIPNALIADLDETASLIRERFAGSLWLMFDIYHMAQAGRDIATSFRQYSDLVRHIQFSDAPGRHEPGTGKIDFADCFEAIEQAGYRGVWGAEYFPSGQTMASFGWRDLL